MRGKSGRKNRLREEQEIKQAKHHDLEAGPPSGGDGNNNGGARGDIKGTWILSHSQPMRLIHVE